VTAIEQTRPVHGFSSAAPVYLEGGWTPFPLPRGQKSPPPKGYTGSDGARPSDEDIRRWCITHKASNIGLHMAATTVGIDVDDYGDKAGAATLAELEQRYGELPPTWRSTSRGSGASSIRFYRIPEGVSFPGQLGAGIDVIQNHHRYAVVAPSTHPDTGERYRWYGPSGERALQPPTTADLADLPTAWVDGLRWRDQITPPAPKVHDETSIAERVNAEHDWHNVLVSDGWQLKHHKGPESDWVRPGKDGRKGISAVLHEPEGPFNVFTTSVAALQHPWAERKAGTLWSYSMFGYLAATRYSGDRSECARDYRARANATDAQLHTFQTVPRVTAALDEEPEPIDDDWAPIDLVDIAARIRSGDYEPIQPTVLAVTGSFPLFYRERINSLFGESGGGKTWVALAAVLDCTRRNGRVLFVDYEDNPAGITERLVLLGMTDDEIRLVDYRNPTSGVGFGVDALAARAEALEYELIVIDSTGEAMAAGGVDSNADREVAQWFALVKRLARIPGGPAVVVLDHVPKDKDAPSSYAIGSQRKRAAVTGASYRVDTLKEPAKGKDGKLKLTVAKDRLGNRPKGSVAAVVDVQSEDGAVMLDFHLSDAQIAAEAGERFRPTMYMERVSRWLELNPGVPKRQLILDVQGKRDMLELALEVMLDEGWIAPGTNLKGAKLFSVVREYREFDDAKHQVTAAHPAHHGSGLPRTDRTDDPRTSRAPSEQDDEPTNLQLDGTFDSAAHPRTSRAPAAHQNAQICRAPAHPPLEGGERGARQSGDEENDRRAPDDDFDF
jgi:hypothetical protein